MRAQWITPDVAIGARRHEAVVCIPVHGAHEHFVRCLRSVLAATPPSVAILVCDDASEDRRSEHLLRDLDQTRALSHPLFYMSRAENVGFPANVNGAFAAAAPADVVLLNSDCIVAEGWLEGLHDAAYAESNIATASSLSNNGSMLSVPERGVPLSDLPQEWSFREAARAVSAGSLRLRPRLVTAVGHCVYIRRSALELVGDFDLAFSPGYGEEVDFSQRCLRHGLCHVAADDVLVFHHGGASFSAHGQVSPLKQQHERMLAERYPYYHPAVRALERDVTGPLARSLGAARRALRGLSIVYDARILAGPLTGSQLHALELIAAVARSGQARVRVVVPEQLGSYARQLFARDPSIELVSSAAARSIAPGDLVHRPYQVSSPHDLDFLMRLGERLVLTQQDLIGYRNPTYFTHYRDWEAYRELTRRALATADRVLFFSEHARADAVAEDIVDPLRASVVPLGTDHSLTAIERAPRPPRGITRLPEDAEMLLCLGTDFRHKNRLFALRLLDQLQQRHDWEGWLVFAGPRVSVGSSASEEDELLALRPRLADLVIDVAAVDEAEKAWLLRRAGLVLYPTVYEGFGLVPFEAADHGVACMWAAGTSLSEILPDGAAAIVPWDAAQSADRALELLRGEDARELNLQAIRSAGAGLRWDATAERLLPIYRAAVEGSSQPGRGLRGGASAETPSVSEDGLRLLGPRGAVPGDLERPLLALATHPQLSRPVFGALKAGYRVSHRLRRGAPKPGTPHG